MGERPVGEKKSEPFQFTFHGFLKVAFQGSRVTSDAGLIVDALVRWRLRHDVQSRWHPHNDSL